MTVTLNVSSGLNARPVGNPVVLNTAPASAPFGETFSFIESMVANSPHSTFSFSDTTNFIDQPLYGFFNGLNDSLNSHEGCSSRLYTAYRIIDFINYISTVSPPPTYISLQDTFVSKPLLLSQLSAKSSISEAQNIKDVCQLIAAIAYTDHLLMLDTETLKTLMHPALAETFNSAPAITTLLHALGATKDSVLIKDAATKALLQLMLDALNLTETPTSKLAALAKMTELLATVSTGAYKYIVNCILAETLVLHDVPGVVLLAFAGIKEGVTFGPTLIFPGAVYESWAINTETLAVSKYTNFAFNSFARVLDEFYAAGPQGVFVLSGDTDAGTPIAAEIDTGFLDFGSPAFKRVTEMLIGYSGNTPMALKVVTSINGVLTETWYEAVASTGDDRESRVKIGRGLRSKYWQFKIVNTGGGSFELDRLDFFTLALSRAV